MSTSTQRQKAMLARTIAEGKACSGIDINTLHAIVRAGGFASMFKELGELAQNPYLDPEATADAIRDIIAPFVGTGD